MDLERWIVDTQSLERDLERARTRNRRVQLLAAQLEQHGEDVVAAALDALVAALDAAPTAHATRAATSQHATPRAARRAAQRALFSDSNNDSDSGEQTPKQKRHRATKAEFEAAKTKLLNALDREGKSARVLQSELGDAFERNALLALLREGRAVVVSRGCYALAD